MCSAGVVPLPAMWAHAAAAGDGIACPGTPNIGPGGIAIGGHGKCAPAARAMSKAAAAAAPMPNPSPMPRCGKCAMGWGTGTCIAGSSIGGTHSPVPMDIICTCSCRVLRYSMASSSIDALSICKSGHVRVNG